MLVAESWHIAVTPVGTKPLKTLRNSLGLSQSKAARQVEVSTRSWARWEAGQKPVPEGAVKLFKLLNGISV